MNVLCVTMAAGNNGRAEWRSASADAASAAHAPQHTMNT